MDYSFVKQNKIIPVVVLNQLEDTLPRLQALLDGGIKVAEITFRTACAPEALSLAVKSFPQMLIGAGTVINQEQCLKAIECGAKFVVSPGFSSEVARICREKDIPYIPGVVTPTEVMMAKTEGLSLLKFFPASSFGGIKTLKALSSAFPDVKFLPTGGIDDKNLAEYLSQKFVVAIGGSWMMKGEPCDITRLSKQAVEIAKEYL